MAWGIWLYKNHNIFEDKLIHQVSYAFQGLSILSSFHQDIEQGTQRKVVKEGITKYCSWGCFNGALKEMPPFTKGEVSSFYQITISEI